MVAIALSTMNVKRPSVEQAQGLDVEPVGAEFCRGCGGEIDFGKKYCSGECCVAYHSRRRRWEQAQSDRAGYLARLAAEKVQRAKARARPCVQCGAVFDHHPNQPKQRYCSVACADAAKLKHVETADCPHCGTAFRVDRPGKSYCSRACYLGACASIKAAS